MASRASAPRAAAQQFHGVFLYRVSEEVRYAGGDGQRYTIRGRRYTQREILPPYNEYLLVGFDIAHAFWAMEADLTPVVADDRASR